MFGIQNLLIAIGISLAVGITGGLYTGWHYTKNHYEAKIAKERDAAQQVVIQSQQKLIAQERINEQTISKLEQTKQQQDKSMDTLYRSNLSLSAKLRGLRVSGSCQTTAGTSVAASSESSSKAGYCQLSTEASGLLLAEANRADKLGSYVNECFAYVQEIQKQRERIVNE